MCWSSRTLKPVSCCYISKLIDSWPQAPRGNNDPSAEYTPHVSFQVAAFVAPKVSCTTLEQDFYILSDGQHTIYDQSSFFPFVPAGDVNTGGVEVCLYFPHRTVLSGVQLQYHGRGFTGLSIYDTCRNAAKESK